MLRYQLLRLRRVWREEAECERVLRRFPHLRKGVYDIHHILHPYVSPELRCHHRDRAHVPCEAVVSRIQVPAHPPELLARHLLVRRDGSVQHHRGGTRRGWIWIKVSYLPSAVKLLANTKEANGIVESKSLWLACHTHDPVAVGVTPLAGLYLVSLLLQHLRVLGDVTEQQCAERNDYHQLKCADEGYDGGRTKHLEVASRTRPFGHEVLFQGVRQARRGHELPCHLRPNRLARPIYMPLRPAAQRHLHQLDVVQVKFCAHVLQQRVRCVVDRPVVALHGKLLQ
mmetsp:Transcript_1699/g.5926  ORF Transcript_1699/g.5926 Transcript_1699/m.5926 type:complete len:284 (-) Transcript_1699:797-1648(-)